MLAERAFCSHRQDGGTLSTGRGISLRCYFEATSALPTAAWPAARRAVSTRNGEHDT